MSGPPGSEPGRRLSQYQLATATAMIATAATAPVTNRAEAACFAGAEAACNRPESESSFISWRATLRSAMACQRRSGSLRRQRLMSLSRSAGIADVMPLTGFGSWCRIAESVDILLPP